MTEIELQFKNDIRVLVLGGRKCCTARRRPHGMPGDTFHIGPCRYRILQVISMYADQVANDLYRSEGFSSPDMFVAWWTRTYGKYDPEEEVFVHFFAAIGPIV